MSDMTSPEPPDNGGLPLFTMARRLAGCGLVTFPLPAGVKKPTMEGWPEKATTDEKVHHGWFVNLVGRCQNGNIGVVTGGKSGVFAFDVDANDGGLETLAALEREHGPLPTTPRQDTPTGGLHYLFRLPAGLDVRNSVKKLAPGLDVRGEGGFIVCEPSTHPDVPGQYAWAPGLAPWEVEPAPAPGWLLGLIRESSKAKAPERSTAKSRTGQRIAEGSRNDTLFKQAARLRGDGHEEEEVTALLSIFNRKNCDPPLSDDEVAAIAASAMRYLPNEHHELNDTGNAERFVSKHRDVARYVADLDLWRVWDGTRWQDDVGNLAVLRLATDVVDDMREAAEVVADATVGKALKQWAKRSGDRARLKAMVDVAASRPGMSAKSDDFDQLPGLLAVANGVVDLSTGELSPHDPARLNTKLAPTRYEADADCPMFMKFLERVQPDPEVRTFLQRYLGHALHGQRREQIMVFWHGRGRNGKSVLADTLITLLPDHAVTTSASTFLADDKKNPNAARSDIMKLRGSRLVLGTEAADRRRLDSVVVKRLTGDATMPCREVYGRETTFPITFSITVLTNPWPNADEADDALWARFVRLPFPVVISPAEQVPRLHEKLVAAEAAGILAWLVRGAVDYARDRLTIPAVLTEATKAWRQRIGTVERFMKTRVRAAAGHSFSLVELHASYTRGEQQAHGNPVGLESFRSRLESLGFTVEDTDRGEVVTDVVLAPPVTKGWASVVAAAA